jgi:hypothetical protein
MKVLSVEDKQAVYGVIFNTNSSPPLSPEPTPSPIETANFTISSLMPQVIRLPLVGNPELVKVIFRTIYHPDCILYSDIISLDVHNELDFI